MVQPVVCASHVLAVLLPKRLCLVSVTGGAPAARICRTSTGASGSGEPTGVIAEHVTNVWVSHRERLDALSARGQKQCLETGIDGRSGEAADGIDRSHRRGGE